MNTVTRSADAEPGGSGSEPRKFSPTIAGLLRDSKQIVEIVRQHGINLPSNARIEEIHDETTLHIRILIADHGDTHEVTFSLNGTLIAHQRPFKRDSDGAGESFDLQEALAAKNPEAIRLLRLCEETFGRIHTRVLNARPPEAAFQHEIPVSES